MMEDAHNGLTAGNSRPFEIVSVGRFVAEKELVGK